MGVRRDAARRCSRWFDGVAVAGELGGIAGAARGVAGRIVAPGGDDRSVGLPVGADDHRELHRGVHALEEVGVAAHGPELAAVGLGRLGDALVVGGGAHVDVVVGVGAVLLVTDDGDDQRAVLLDEVRLLLEGELGGEETLLLARAAVAELDVLLELGGDVGVGHGRRVEDLLVAGDSHEVAGRVGLPTEVVHRVAVVAGEVGVAGRVVDRAVLVHRVLRHRRIGRRQPVVDGLLPVGHPLLVLRHDGVDERPEVVRQVLLLAGHGPRVVDHEEELGVGHVLDLVGPVGHHDDRRGHRLEDVGLAAAGDDDEEACQQEPGNARGAAHGSLRRVDGGTISPGEPEGAPGPRPGSPALRAGPSVARNPSERGVIQGGCTRPRGGSQTPARG